MDPWIRKTARDKIVTPKARPPTREYHPPVKTIDETFKLRLPDKFIDSIVVPGSMI